MKRSKHVCRAEGHQTIVVTRHPALREFLLEIGLIDGHEPFFEHVTAEDVLEKNVIGVLPLSMASLAWQVTEVTLALEPEDRGKELPIERIRQIFIGTRTYVVRATSDEWEDNSTCPTRLDACAECSARDRATVPELLYCEVLPGVWYYPRCRQCHAAPGYVTAAYWTEEP